MQLRERIEKVLNTLGLNLLPNPFDDVAHAGEMPKDGNDKIRRFTAYLIASLVGVFRDCMFVDVSRWQGNIDFTKMKSAGIKGAILKCGQGAGIDIMFRENWKKAKEAGLLRGCYWYYDSRIDPKKQAQLWATTMREVGFGELPFMLDYEEEYGGDWAGIHHFLTFLQEFQRLLSLRDDQIGVYTGYFYWMENGSQDSFWTRYWLWLAWYGAEQDVIIPRPWNQSKLFGWQYTSSGDGTAHGVSSKEIDLNFFVKGWAIWKTLYGGEDTPLPPQAGEEGMYEAYSDVYTMWLRSAPNGTQVEKHVAGTRFLCDKINVAPTSGGVAGDRWAHVVEVNGVRKDLWVAQVHLGEPYCKVVAVSPTTAEPKATITFTDPSGKVYEATDVSLKPQ